MSHADAVREAEKPVLDAACLPMGLSPANYAERVCDAAIALTLLRAATCTQCGGAGRIGRWNTSPAMADQCPANCDEGRKRNDRP